MQLNKVTIGIPHEILNRGKRVAAVPETVEKMISAGARVLIKANAGKDAINPYFLKPTLSQ